MLFVHVTAGYAAYSELGRKAAALYRMCAQQLYTSASRSSSDSNSSSSKRCCYDFSLRAAVAALRQAGSAKRAATAAATNAQNTDATIRSSSVAFSTEGSSTTAVSTTTATGVSEESIIAELIRCAVVPSLAEQVSEHTVYLNQTILSDCACRQTRYLSH
jgi:hypothetical protein